MTMRTARLLLLGSLVLAACGGSKSAKPWGADAGPSAGSGVAGTHGTAGAAGADAGAAGASAGAPDAADAGAVGGAAGTSVGVADAGAAGTSATAGASGAGGSSHGDPFSAACQEYCGTIMANCTGARQQYADLTNCAKVCSYMPTGTPTDNGVDSVGCRTNAAKDAVTDTSRCWGAGPLSFGICGNDCNTFCLVATSYCTADGGFQGTPPYKNFDDCLSTCGQFSRVIDPVAPGAYRAAYSPGPTPDTTDTLECRAYHLFINALLSAAGQRSECPNAANMSPACGAGIPTIPPA
jgi:hypothetical protein